MQPRAQDGDQKYRQQNRRKGHPNVDRARNQGIDELAEKAREQPKQRADQTSKPGRDEGDCQRYARAENDAREHVAAKPIGAEQKSRLGVRKSGGWERRIEEVLRQRILRRDQRRANRKNDQKPDEAAGTNHFGVAQ